MADKQIPSTSVSLSVAAQQLGVSMVGVDDLVDSGLLSIDGYGQIPFAQLAAVKEQMELLPDTGIDTDPTLLVILLELSEEVQSRSAVLFSEWVSAPRGELADVSPLQVLKERGRDGLSDLLAVLPELLSA